MFKEIELRNIWHNGHCGPEDTNVVFINGKRAKKEDIPRTRPYNILEKKAQDLGLPEAFKDDLYKHDRLTLFKYKPGRFLWILRPTGTRIVFLEEEKSIVRMYTSGSCRNDKIRFFWYEKRSKNKLGKEVFKEVDPEKVESFLAGKKLYTEKDFFDWVVYCRPWNDWRCMSSTVKVMEKGLFKYKALEKATKLNAARKAWDAQNHYFVACKEKAFEKAFFD